MRRIRWTTLRSRVSIAALLRRLAPLAGLVALMWAVRFVDIAFGGELTMQFGLVPRTLDGLDGVLAMPFLHGNFAHLISNTTPLLVLGALLLFLTPKRFWAATAICILLGGALTWGFARPFNHIGASGLVFGWFGFMVALGLLERSAQALIGAAIALLLYGTPTLLGLAPTDARVSWDGHLAGLIAGVVAAWRLRENPRRRSRSSGRRGKGSTKVLSSASMSAFSSDIRSKR